MDLLKISSFFLLPCMLTVIEFKAVSQANISLDRDLTRNATFISCDLDEPSVLLENDFFVVMGLPSTFKSKVLVSSVCTSLGG